MNNWKVVVDQVVPPKTARAIEVKKGQRVRVVDIEGKQISDFTALNARNLKERLNCSRTIGKTLRWRVQVGDPLYTNYNNVMFTVLEDTCGVHDFGLSGTCDSKITYRMRHKEDPPRDGCCELLYKALKKWGLEYGDLPDTTFNIFQNTPHDPVTGEVRVEEPKSKPGDYLELRAEMDCIIALTACPNDIDPKINGGRITPIGLKVYADQHNE